MMKYRDKRSIVATVATLGVGFGLVLPTVGL